MVDLVITPANVVKGAGATTLQGIAGETLTAGMAVYRDAASKKFLKADADAASAGVRNAVGIALNGAALDQPVVVQTDGEITLGAVLAVGTAYYVSNTPGAIMPAADLSIGEYAVLLGIARTAAILRMKILNSEAAVP